MSAFTALFTLGFETLKAAGHNSNAFLTTIRVPVTPVKTNAGPLPATCLRMPPPNESGREGRGSLTTGNVRSHMVCSALNAMIRRRTCNVQIYLTQIADLGGSSFAYLGFISAFATFSLKEGFFVFAEITRSACASRVCQNATCHITKCHLLHREMPLATSRNAACHVTKCLCHIIKCHLPQYKCNLPHYKMPLATLRNAT